MLENLLGWWRIATFLGAGREAREMLTTFASMMLTYAIVGRLDIERVLLVCECRECDVG